MSSLKKFKPPRSGKMINICSVKNVRVFQQKYCWGGGMFVHPKKEPTHTKKMALTSRERTAQIEKKNIWKKATPPPPPRIFLFPPPPGRALTLAPSFPRASAYSCPSLRSAGNDRPPPLTLFLFLENFKKSAKITGKTLFWFFHFTITYQILIFSFVNINVLINF